MVLVLGITRLEESTNKAQEDRCNADDHRCDPHDESDEASPVTARKRAPRVTLSEQSLTEMLARALVIFVHRLVVIARPPVIFDRFAC